MLVSLECQTQFRSVLCIEVKFSLEFKKECCIHCLIMEIHSIIFLRIKAFQGNYLDIGYYIRRKVFQLLFQCQQNTSSLIRLQVLEAISKSLSPCHKLVQIMIQEVIQQLLVGENFIKKKVLQVCKIILMIENLTKRHFNQIKQRLIKFSIKRKS